MPQSDNYKYEKGICSSDLNEPIEIISDGDIKRVALPPQWTLVEKDDEKLLAQPRRKKARIKAYDTESFVDYINRHGSNDGSTIWCHADYLNNNVSFLSIINDYGSTEEQANWQDHTACFVPEFSEEWNRWIDKNKKGFSQVEFATFIEDNLKDIANIEGHPTGSQMLEMALTFEANQDMRFKSAIRLQNGGVQMSFVQDDDAQTIQKMQVFDRFSIGLPVFWNGKPYRLDARLRYRVRDGKLSFWYELIRTDKVLEDATKTIIEEIKSKTEKPFFFGNPFYK